MKLLNLVSIFCAVSETVVCDETIEQPKPKVIIPELGQFQNSTSNRIENFVHMSDAVSINSRLRDKILEDTRNWDNLNPHNIIVLSQEDHLKSTQQGNCYNYVTSTTSAPGTAGRNPGEKIAVLKEKSCPELEKHLLQTPNIRIKTSLVCEADEREILMFVTPESSDRIDYHFVAKGPDGKYTHKPGPAPVSEISKDYIEAGWLPEDSLILGIKTPDRKIAFNNIRFPAYEICENRYCFDPFLKFKLAKNNEKTCHERPDYGEECVNLQIRNNKD